MRDHPLVGRDGECALLADRADKARWGHAQCVVVRGPAGIGKSRLLSEILHRELANGFTVLHTRCEEGRTRFNYDVVRDLFGPLGLTAENTADSPLLQGSASWAVSTLLPDSAGDEHPGRYAALYGLYWLAVNLMGTGPLALIVDDAHRCDEQSLSWLDFLLRRADDLPLLVLLAYRTDEVGEPEMAVLSEIVARGSCVVVDPKPLTEAEVGEVVATALAELPGSKFARACTTVSGGNPLLLSRLLDEIRRSGTQSDADGMSRIKEVGPDLVSTLVLVRLAAQPGHVRTVAAAVAVLGDGAETELVAALAGVTPKQIADALDALRNSNIVAASTVEFVHDCVRDAVLGDMPAGELERLRVRAARLLNDAGKPPAQVADQLLTLSTLDHAWMVDVLRDAAATAGRQGAPGTAVRYLRRVLEAEPDPASQSRIRIDLGRALAQIDPYAALPIMREALAAITDHGEYIRVALDYVTTAFHAHSYSEAFGVLADVQRKLATGRTGSASDRELRAQADSILLTIGIGQKSTFGLVRERARTMPLPEGKTPAGRRILAATACIEAFCCGPRDDVLEWARTALRLGEFDSDAWTDRYALGALFLADEVEEVLVGFGRSIAAAKSDGELWSYSYSMAWHARMLHQIGEVRRAAADAQTAVEICEQALWGESTAAQVTAWAAVLVEQGQPEEAEAWLERLSRPRFEEATVEWPLFMHVRARARWLRGDRDTALDMLMRCGESLEEAGLVNPAVLPWRTDAACLLAESGRAAEAAELLERDREWAECWATPRVIGVNLLAQGVVAEGRKSVELLTDAVEVLGDSPARLEEARARYRLGKALLRIDDVRGARKELRGAVDLATLCGSMAIAETARELVVAAGGRVGQAAQATVAPVDLLTGSEHRVAMMASGEATNREIAEALFVTLRTVETHLTNVYRKLRVSSRADLAATLDERQSPVDRLQTDKQGVT
jgi:DNA-binding CsgD family transcriptional regulator